MPGGLLQLSAFGSASTFLHSEPQITFWKQAWRRSTAFALESIEMGWNGSAPNFGTKVTAAISKGADMAHRAWLEITLPDLADYCTTYITATSSQPLIKRAYIDGNYVKIRIARPAGTPPSGSWTGGWVKVRANGVFLGTDNVNNTLFQIGAGEYTDYSIARADLPAAFTSTPVSLTAIAVDSSFGNASTESMARPVLNLRWTNSVGHALVESCEWEVGGSRVDKIPNSDFFDVWSELTEKQEKLAGFNSMVGKYPDYDIWSETKSNRAAKTYFVPLPFTFCQTPGQAIPIIALTFNEVRLSVTFREALDLVRCNVPISALVGPTGAPIAITTCQLFLDMVFLDTEERRRMSSMEHEQLVVQCQYLGDYTIAPSDPGLVRKIPLDGLSHPVKELIWVYQGYSRYQRNAVTGNDHHNYQLENDPDEDAFLNVRLTLNGTERAPPRSGQYYRQVQPYQHHTRVPTKHVLCYNFGLEPESANPTGSCNFSRLEQASLNVTLSPNIDPNGGKIKIFALSYNILRYAQGLAGLAFSSG